MSHKKSFWLSVLLYALFAFSLLSPLASNEQLPLGQDFQNHTATIVQAGMALKEGQFPLRVAPWEHRGFRYPEFQFYSPLSYTLAGAIYNVITPKNPYQAFKVMLWIALVLGGTYIYRTAQIMTSYTPAAILAGLAYMAAPYFLININARGAMAEAFAQGLVPVVLYYTYLLYRHRKLRYVCLSAITWSFLAMTHVITFMNTSIFMGLFFFCLCVKDYPSRLGWLALAYILGCLLSVWYFAPIKMLSHALNIADHFSFPSSTNNLTSLLTLLAVTPAGPIQPGTYANLLTLPFYPGIGLPMMIGVGVAVYFLWNKNYPIEHSLEKMLKPLLWVFFLALFLAWSPLNFWKYLPHFLSATQFSYRFLAQIMWIGALLLSISIKQIFQEKSSAIILIVGLWLIALSSSGWLSAHYAYATFAKNMVNAPSVGYAKDDYLLKVDSNITPSFKKIKFPPCMLQKNNVICDVPESHLSQVTLPILYYPHAVEVKLEGDVIHTEANVIGKYALIKVDIPEGPHQVTEKFIGFSWANWVSGILWLGMVGILSLHLFRRTS